MVTAVVLGAGGCEEVREPGGSVLPESPTPCASWSPGHTPEPPHLTRVTYRAEEFEDGSVVMTVGDVDAAPQDPDAVRTVDYREPAAVTECETVRIEPVSGWWCATTVEPIAVEGEIVVGGAEPRAEIGGEGFATECHGDLPGRMRQVSVLERDSWSGWRDYGDPRYTSWTRARSQQGPARTEPCPQGRTGTYNYRLAVRVEVDSVTVGESWAASPHIRTDCGTGVS
ncbi:hypothetical protein [Streptomyces sp. MAR4 CNX-425]|uniref:hypothetical protein n=1 Tax=Streptomyces sp. MAR4 CNX-425 TaxID=3406343 RepID=UPI003B50B061